MTAGPPAASQQTETLERTLKRAAHALAEPASLLASWETPVLQREAEALVLAALMLPRAALYQQPERLLTPTETQRINHWLQQRQAGVPLAYLTGQREFWSLSLEVTPDVLIPRPETELLVEQTLRRAHERQRLLDRPLQILELGTGSGAIILALCREHPNWQYTATDVSTAALAVAQRNATRLGQACDAIQFLQGDWFTPLEGRVFDVIVSNPPYVAANDPCLMSDSLCHEPMLALTPGEDACADLRHIIQAARAHLHPGGWLLLEHGAQQGPSVQAELRRNGYTAETYTDLAGHGRISAGCFNP